MTQIQLDIASRQVVGPYRPEWHSWIQDAKDFTWQGNRYSAVPYNEDTTRILRNVNVDLPPPILNLYRWPGSQPPFHTQKMTAAFLTMHTACHVHNDIGTGKTRSALFAFDWLRQQKRAKKMLVVAPLSTLTNVWKAEIAKYFHHMHAIVLHGSKEQRIKKLAEPAAVYIINHDGVGVIEQELRARSDIDVILIDEVAVYRNASSVRWKVMNRVKQGRAYFWTMTGSPTPSAPTDAWAQGRLVNPSRVPPSFTMFRDAVMTQVSQFRWLPKPNAKQIVRDALQPCIRFTREETVELPPVTYQDRLLKLSPTAGKLYDELRRHAKVTIANGDVRAENAGVLMSKLLQVACGWVYYNDGVQRQTYTVPCQSRLDTLLSVLDETDRKIIVFVPYRNATVGVHKFLCDKNIDAAMVHGDVSPTERNRIFGAFQGVGGPRVLVAHPKAMAHGLTLTAANVVVWFAPETSLETYEQANGRITRPGQTAASFIIHLVATPIEAQIYRGLRNKQLTQNDLLKLLENDTTTY